MQEEIHMSCISSYLINRCRSVSLRPSKHYSNAKGTHVTCIPCLLVTPGNSYVAQYQLTARSFTFTFFKVKPATTDLSKDAFLARISRFSK